MSKRTFILASATLVAVAIAPFALAAGEGNPVRGGNRNPSSDASLAYTRETQIIANNSTYGTRQSNKSDNGGGAIYGCRSAAGGTAANNEPCIRANNLPAGRAFEVVTQGAEGGRIEAVAAGAKPFTTNATGVATGLNADQVDGKSASDIVAYAQNLTKFAAVAGTGALSAGRGAASASRAADPGDYRVVFNDDVSKCAY